MAITTSAKTRVCVSFGPVSAALAAWGVGAMATAWASPVLGGGPLKGRLLRAWSPAGDWPADRGWPEAGTAPSVAAAVGAGAGVPVTDGVGGGVGGGVGTGVGVGGGGVGRVGVGVGTGVGVGVGRGVGAGVGDG
jgi:hypothetical protein